MFKLDLEKAEEPDLKLPTFGWIIEKAREFQKNTYLWFIDYAKDFDCVGHNKLWKFLKEMRIPDHLTRMEYYSAIKRNIFESVLMRWMNLSLLYRVK